MRLFLEFVSCCGSNTQRPVAQTTSSQPLTDEERSFVPLSSQTRDRKKRGTSAAPEWRPSLGSISEDNIVAQRERGDAKNGKMGSKTELKRRSGTTSAAAAAAAKVHHRNYGDDYGRATVPTMMPAFSPTPFMF